MRTVRISELAGLIPEIWSPPWLGPPRDLYTHWGPYWYSALEEV